MPNLDLHGFVAPPDPYQGLFQIGRNLERINEKKYLIDWRNQKSAEADQERKLGIVRDFADVSKYHTGDDVADAIANQKTNDILQKYSLAAPTMSMPELQYNLAKETGTLLSATSSIRDQLNAGDKAMVQLKAAHPDLDIEKLSSANRADIVHRYLNADGSDFDNPTSIANKTPNLNLNDPEVLSGYLKGNSQLDKIVSDRTGLEERQVLTGNPYEHNDFRSKVPFYMQQNFNPNDVKSGYLPKNFVPQLSIKSEPISSEYLPALKNQDRRMVTDDVYDKFKADAPLNVIAGAQRMFPNYGDMGEGEKKIAEKDYLYKYLQSQGNSLPQYTSGQGTHTPASIIKLNMGKTGDETNVRDVYNEITTKGDTHANGNVPLVDLTTQAQSVALKQARDLTGDNTLSQSDIYISKYPDGKTYIKRVSVPNEVHKNDPVIGEMDFGGTNLPVQPGVKEKRQVVKEANQQQSQGKGKYDF